uniref:DNA polymerase zeta catalytic subunit n=1 Tax=Timema cristinae TaxID=61476 RepID=A0A7R9GWZ4_TIMCR|nr:unnamed protein product [Timema cristinae]
MFSVRLVTADFYMSTPIRTLDVGYSDFRGAEVKQIPVIRVFGSTLTGRKVCLHIHGVFPYIYIPYDGAEPYERLVYQVASALDKALNISQGSATSNTQHVYKIILVSGIPFYGYHAREHQFLKIYLYNPLMVKKTAELLQNGAILNKVFQPQEAHLTFILQFMIDYNLFGMSPVNLSAVKFRRSSETQGRSQEDIPEDLLLPEKVTRISSCDLEVDALATDILNRNTITGGELSVNPGLAGIWEDEKQRRRVEGRVSQITPQLSQERPFSHSTRSELCFKQLLKEKLRNQNSQDVNKGSVPQDVSYPAETPHDTEMIGASFLEPHVTPVSRVPVAPSTNEDDSVVNVELVLSLSSCGPRTPGLMQSGSQQLNSQDMQLMKDLNELHDHSVSVDDDSILGSQRTTCDAWQNGNEEEEENNLEDLSQPLEEPSGDMKDFSALGDFSEKLKSDMDDDINDGLWEESFWNDIATHIPQLDGADDIPTKPRRKGFLRKDRGSTVRSRIPLKRPPSSLSTDDGLSNSSTRSQNEDSNELLARSCTSEQVSTRKATHLGCIEECSVMNSPISECGDNYLGSGANIRVSDYSYIANVDSNICVGDKKVSVGEDAFNAVNTDRESPYPTCTNLSDEAQTSIITLSDNEIEYLDTPVSDAPVIVISDEEDDFNSDASDSDNVVITLSDSEKEYVDNPPSDCGNTSFFGFVDTPVSECRTTPISDNMDFNIGAPETSSQASDVAWLLKDIVKEKCLEEEIFKDDFNSYFSHNNIDPKSPCPLLSESAEAIEASNTALIEAQNVSDLERYNTFNTFNLNGDNFDNVLIGDPKLSSMLSFSEKDDSLVETENNLSEICLGGQPMLSDAPELDVVMQAFSDLGSNEYNDILTDPRLSTCLDNNLGNDQTLSMSSFDVIKTPETSITEIKSQSINLRQRAPKKSQPQRKPNVPKVDNLLNNVDTSTAVQNLLNNVDTSTAVQTTSVAKQFEKNKPTYPKQGRHGKTAITSKVASDALTALDSRSIGSVVPLNTQGLQNESEQTNNKVLVVLPLRTFKELSCAVDQGSGLNGEATSDITKQTKIVYPAQRLVSRKAPKRKQTSEPVLEQMLVNKSTNTDRFTGLLNCNVLNGVSFTAVKAHKSSGKQDIIESQNLNKTPQQPSTSVPKRRGRPRKSQNLANIASTNNSFGTPISVVSNNNFTFYEISKWIAIPNANVVKTNTQTPQNEPTNNYDPYEFCEDADDCVNKNQSYRGLRFPSTSFEPKNTVENYTKTLKPEMVITSTSKINEQSNRKSISSKASNMMIIGEKSKHGNLPLTPKKIQAILMPKSVPDFVPVKPMNVPRGYYSTCMESNAPQVDGKQGECFENKTSVGSSSLDFGKSTVTGNNNVRATKKAVIPKVTLKRYGKKYKPIVNSKRSSLSTSNSFIDPKEQVILNPHIKVQTNDKVLNQIRPSVSHETEQSGTSVTAHIWIPNQTASSYLQGTTNILTKTQEPLLHKIKLPINTFLNNQPQNCIVKITKPNLSTVFPSSNSSKGTINDSYTDGHMVETTLISERIGTADRRVEDDNPPDVVNKKTVNNLTDLSLTNSLQKVSSTHTLNETLSRYPEMDSRHSLQVFSNSKPDAIRSNKDSIDDSNSLATTQHIKGNIDSCKNVIGPLTKKRSLSSQCSSKQYLSSSKSHCVPNVSARKDSSRDSLGYSSPEYIPDTPPPATKGDMLTASSDDACTHGNERASKLRHIACDVVTTSSKKPDELIKSDIEAAVEKNITEDFPNFSKKSVRKKLKFSEYREDLEEPNGADIRNVNIEETGDQELSTHKDNTKISQPSHMDLYLQPSTLLSDKSVENKQDVFNSMDSFSLEKLKSLQRLSQDVLVNVQDNLPSSDLDADDENEDDEGIISFYVATQNSDLLESDYSLSDSCIEDDLGEEKITPFDGLDVNLRQDEDSDGISNTERDNLPSFTTPKFKFQEPFYSNSSDVTGPVEVGNKILHIKYKMVTDVHIYENGLCNENINNNRSARSNAVSLPHDPVQLKIMKSASSNQTEITVPPPSVDELWEKANNMLKRKQLSDNLIKERKQKITRIHMPSSPGANDVSDCELSLSPCSQATDAGSSPFNENALVLVAHSTPMQQCLSSTGHKPRFSKYKSWKEKMSRRRKSSSLTPPNCHKPSDGDVSLPSVCEEATVEEEQSTGQDDQHKSMGNPSVLMSAVSGQLTSSTSTQILSQNSTLLKDVLSDEFLSQSATPLGPKRRPSSGYQITGCTPNNTHAFRMSFENLQEGRAVTEHQYLTLLSLELHVKTRGDLRPDPDYDPIRALFYCVVNDVPEHSGLPQRETGVFAVHDTTSVGQSSVLPPLARTGVSCQVEYVKDESALITSIQQLVTKWDPDILAGYEVEMQSWGYLFQRAFSLGVNLVPLVSRVPLAVRDSFMTNSQEEGEMKVAGRVVLNVWRLMRNEVSLTSYTFENVMYHVLHQRVALHSFKSLSQWWEHPTPLYRWITVEHYLTRVDGLVNLLGQLDLIARTSELARLFGIQFYEVLSRGSQFRVESMMLRLAKPMNFVPVTPSIRQRAKMRAPEHIQLIMEPESRMFVDPVIVLDFQSLYPSIIIGYNYCFSTCLGRVEHLGKHGVFEFGCTQLKVPLSQQLQLEENLNISPCGVAFVDAGVRQGILPRMLQEILETRLMVKKSMKEHKDNKILQRILHARQLGLKLIANVTYGYTAANFSGRMPCVEVGDSVVSKGRETLERAIDMVENTPRWNAHVVYGDTDSLFVLVKGRNRQQAFKIGAEIAEAVTRDNPKPVKLKLEKVYQPCILQTKKRYVGYMYEHPEQKTPTYDAKGIETVRRDGCPVVAKMLEKCLKLLFETRDVSLVKRYVCRQFDKLLQGRTNIQDLMFAKEYRGMAGYKAGACVPALELTRRWLQTDKRAEPRVRERVPYVVVNGPPGVPLIRLVRSPHELLENPSLRVNVTYYITRVIIPPLNRCFSLIGADVDKWYATMPRKFLNPLPWTVPTGQKKSTISQYFATMSCAVCGSQTHSGLCGTCQTAPQAVAVVLNEKLRAWERAHTNINKVLSLDHFDRVAALKLWL